MRRRAQCIVGLAAALVLAGWIAIFAASPAYAHANLIASSPANGAELDEPPEEIRLRFSERITVIPNGITLRDSKGAVVATEPAVVAAGDATTAVLPVPPELAHGGYVVSFRVISADAHPVTGALVFGVGAAAASLDGINLTTTSGVPVSAAFTAARWVSYAALAVLAGGLTVLVLCWPGGWADRRSRRVLLAGWGASLGGAVAVLFLQGPYSTGRSIVALADPDLLASTLGTDFGTYVLIRLGLVLIAGGLLIGATRIPARARDIAALTIGVALPATWVGTGHANATNSIVDKAVDVAHVVAMSSWFGGLALLAVCLLPRSAASSLHADEVGRALRRFSLLATAAVATLVCTGTYLAWRRVGTFDSLIGTQYGRLLAFKLAAMGVLLWLGALSRSVVQRRYAAAASELEEAATVNQRASVAAGARGSRPVPAAGPARLSRSKRRAARSTLDQERTTRVELGRSVRLEVGLAIGVLAVASLLVATPPGVVVTAAEALARTPAGPVLEDVPVNDDGAARVLVDPAWVGRNRVVVELLGAAGEPWDVPEVRATLVSATGDVGPLPIAITRTGPGVYKAGDLRIPFAGHWRLDITVRSTEIDSTTVRVDVPVR